MRQCINDNMNAITFLITPVAVAVIIYQITLNTIIAIYLTQHQQNEKLV